MQTGKLIVCVFGFWRLLIAQVPAQTAHAINVKNYGATGDCRYVDDATIQAGSAVLTSAMARFTSNDVGKPIYLLGAGSVIRGRADPLSTTISSVERGATAVLANAAQTTVSNARVSWGTDDRASIEKAIDAAAAAGGGTVYLPAGTYRITRVLTIVASNIRIMGDGNNSVIYMSSVYTAADGPLLNQGDGLSIIFVGVRGTATSNIEIDHLKLTNAGTEVHNSVNGSGLITFVDGAGADNFKLHDLTVETSSRVGIVAAAISNGFEIYNNSIVGGLHGFYIAGRGSNGYIHDNRFVNTRFLRHQYNSVGIAIKNQNNCRVIHNVIEGYRWGILIPDWPSEHITVDNNMVSVASELGSVVGIGGNNGRQIVISNNQIACQTAGRGIWFYTNRLSNIEVTGNTIENCSNGIKFDGTSTGTGPSNLKVKANSISGCGDGIRMQNVGGMNVIQGNKQWGCSGLPWLVVGSQNGSVTYFSQDNATDANTPASRPSFDKSVRQLPKSAMPQ